MYEDIESTAYIGVAEPTQFAPSCLICTHHLFSTSLESYVYYDSSTPIPQAEDFLTPHFENEYNNSDLIAKFGEAYSKIKYRGFEKVKIFNKTELEVLSQINIADVYFNTTKTIEDEDRYYIYINEEKINYERDISFSFNPVEATLCELMCKIGLEENKIQEIIPIVANVIHAVSTVFGSYLITARISDSTHSIGWHFDDFDSNQLYNGMTFAFSILGPGTMAYSPNYQSFEAIQNSVDNHSRVSFDFNLALSDKKSIIETPLGEGLFFIAGADIGTLHSAPEYCGKRIVFILRERKDITYNPNLNECPVASASNLF